MALSNATFTSAGGAVDSLFAGFGATAKARLTAEGQRITAGGMRIGAGGTRISASGTRISSDSTQLSAEGLRIKAGGDIAEAENYDLAAGLARQNEQFTAASTRLQQTQLDRQVTQVIGGQRAAFGAAGVKGGSGSALDIMRDSASQGALARGTLGMQGAITEAGFEEQAKSFNTMSAAARTTAAGEMDIADKTDVIAMKQLGVADQQDQLADQQDQLATREDALAVQTEAAGKTEAKGDFISSAIKGAAAIATLFI